MNDGHVIWKRDDRRSINAGVTVPDDAIIVGGYLLDKTNGQVIDDFGEKADQTGLERTFVLGGCRRFIAYEMKNTNGDRSLRIYDRMEKRFFVRGYDLEAPRIFFADGRVLGVIKNNVVLYDFQADEQVWSREFGAFCDETEWITFDGSRVYVLRGDGTLTTLSLERGETLARTTLLEALGGAEQQLRVSLINAGQELYVWKRNTAPQAVGAFSFEQRTLLWSQAPMNWEHFHVSGDIVYVMADECPRENQLYVLDRFSGALIKEVMLPLYRSVHVSSGERIAAHDMLGTICCFAV